MKKIILLFVCFLLFSCGLDSSKIIGQKASWDSLPYGEYEYGLDGSKYINGIEYRVYCVFYRYKVLVYVFDKNQRISDYFFSNFTTFNKAKKIPLGTDYSEIVKKFGEPAFLYPSYRDGFYCEYFQLDFDKSLFKYKLSQTMVCFGFDSEGKLIYVTPVYEWRP